MSFHTLFTAVACTALTVSMSAVHAQSLSPGQTAGQVNLRGMNQFKTGLDGGGDFDWYEVGARIAALHQFSPTFAAGASLDYSYQKWNWSNPGAFGSLAPWSAINTTKLGLNLTYSPSPDLRFSVIPTIEWSGESGVGTSDSALYGGLASVSKTFSPDLTLGIGAGVFREFDKTSAFPFLVINWKITDKLTLKNPLPAGPAGGAGLELEYAANDRWTLGVGGTWRKYRFRLNDSGPFAGGIGQNRMIPVFARASYAFSRTTAVDLYAFATFAGNVQAQSADQQTTLNTGYDTGIGLAVNFTHRF